MGPLVGAMASGVENLHYRFASMTTFVITASGLSAFGIGAAFWGLVTGLVIVGFDRLAKIHSDRQK